MKDMLLQQRPETNHTLEKPTEIQRCLAVSTEGEKCESSIKRKRGAVAPLPSQQELTTSSDVCQQTR